MIIAINKILKLFLRSCPFFFIVLISAHTASADVDFDKLYGSDLGMGIGARAIGLGGAFVSIANDASSVYWNPAGMTDIKPSIKPSTKTGISGVQLFLSAEAPTDFSTASVIFSPKLSFLQTIDFTLGVSYIRRLRFSGESGTGDRGGYPSHLLDLSMVDVGENFSGKINSKTCDTRISMAFSPLRNKKLSFGFNYIFLK
jgi:hypothetical protein